MASVGARGSGHYINMVHNDSEDGMLSTVSEAWPLLHKSLRLSNKEIGKIFQKWNSEDTNGERQGQDGHVLDNVLDRTVQDDGSSEGTLFWSVAEATNRHVSAPTIAAGQFFRVASGDREQRLRVTEKMKMKMPAKVDVKDEEGFIENLRRAVFNSLLCRYCQGLELIA